MKEKRHTGERSGDDRRSSIDDRNPGLQSWMRQFWARYFRDNPEKERRTNPDRRTL